MGYSYRDPPARSMTALALGALVWTLGNRQEAGADSAGSRPLGFGSRECPLDISVLWTADVDSPVYSTPVILPSPIDGRNQVLLLIIIGSRMELY